MSDVKAKKGTRRSRRKRQHSKEIVTLKEEDNSIATKSSEKGSNGKNVEYYDSSDEEDLRNTIGNIPVEWYDDEEHIGYNQDGEKISKPAKKGEIDSFLEKMEDPDYWRKVFDRQSGTDVVLSKEQVDTLNALSAGKCPTIGYNPYQPFLDLIQPTIYPIDNIPARKSAFIPSKDEMLQVSKMVHAIKMGWLKPRRLKVKEAPKAYDLWANEDEEKNKSKTELTRMRMHFPAPKVTLPSHAESYNPPEEYLLTEEEKKKWEEMDPEDRRISFIPQKFDALRRLPMYEDFITERYDRCLDLYLAPRQRKLKLNVKDHTELLPDLPNPNDLKPFPTTLAYIVDGHDGQVRCVSFESSGTELLVSGGQDGFIKVWSISSGRCIKSISLGASIISVAFCPAADKTLIAAVVEGKKCVLLNTECGDRLLVSGTSSMLSSLPIGEIDSKLDWKRNDKTGRVHIETPLEMRSVVWHAKGDYLATASPADSASAVFIHQISKAKSQCPFTKKKGLVRGVAFATTVPQLFLATERHVRVYDLARCQLLKKLQTNTVSISTIVTDNLGENLFVGGLDRRFSWMDLQLSTKPWKTLRHHSSAIRAIAYHKRLPLLATAGDDGTAIVYYARIHVDSFAENEIVPVKRLSAHKKVNGCCVLSLAWHPTQAWLFTSGADGKIGMFSY